MRPGASRGTNTLPPPEAALERLGVPLDSGQIQTLEAYGTLVRRWNGVAGLVAKNDLRRFFDRHVLDSLVLAPLIRRLEKTGAAGASRTAPPAVAPLPIADFGSGAGLPGVPLAVALPELPFLLVDRSEKKTRFLRRVRDQLTLRNLRVLCADVRSLPGGACSGVVARAVMPVPELWRHARAAIGPGGYLLVLDRLVRSGPEPPSELPEGCTGGALRRHWQEMPELDAWHGVLEIREIDQ